ncbi:MAG: exodeoxyribonuclease I [Pseudomonadota bacterium]
MGHTFYWHDYETSGIDPGLDRPMQFAGIRTDRELNVCGDPLRLYCQIAPDVLPHPAACAVTGITPQIANSLGVCEREFIAAIHNEMIKPGTCSVGYNSIRFDDEFTRFTLYRNFYDAYEREYRNGNSRWDLIDVARLCCALRPDGIVWPEVDGKPSFRLELLSEANGILHDDAHDALSDVLATIEFAKLIKQRKPKLFDYALQLRNKRFAAGLLDTASGEPILHVSSKLPAEYFCATLVLPVAAHPTNSNGIVCVDLRNDPQPLLNLPAVELRRLLFLSADERDADTPRIPLKTIHLNRSPMVATARLLDEPLSRRLQLDLETCQDHAQRLLRDTSWISKLQTVYELDDKAPERDVDAALYGHGFFSDSDRTLMQDVRRSAADRLASHEFAFADPRLENLLFRYRARNFPDSLSPQEQDQWLQHCKKKHTEMDGFGFEDFRNELERLRKNEANVELSAALEQYADELAYKIKL